MGLLHVPAVTSLSPPEPTLPPTACNTWPHGLRLVVEPLSTLPISRKERAEHLFPSRPPLLKEGAVSESACCALHSSTEM